MILAYELLEPGVAAVLLNGQRTPLIVIKDAMGDYRLKVLYEGDEVTFYMSPSYRGREGAEQAAADVLGGSIYISKLRNSSLKWAYKGGSACLVAGCASWAQAANSGYVIEVYKPSGEG